jgi:hypothetical protein
MKGEKEPANPSAEAKQPLADYFIALAYHFLL